MVCSASTPPRREEVASLVYYGIYALQHRGHLSHYLRYRIAYVITIDAKNPQYKKPPRFLRGGLLYAKDCMMFWAISFLDVQQSMACFSM